MQANAFAAELLAPAAGVRAMLDGEPTLEDVVRIAARYGISPIAAVFRLGTLRLSRRIDALRREIDDGLATDVWRHLALPPFADEIAAIGATTCRACRPPSPAARSRRSLPGARRSLTPRAPRTARPSGSPAARRRSGSRPRGRRGRGGRARPSAPARRPARRARARRCPGRSSPRASSSARKNAWLGAAGAGGDGSAMRTPPSVSDSASTSRRDRRPGVELAALEALEVGDRAIAIGEPEALGQPGRDVADAEAGALAQRRGGSRAAVGAAPRRRDAPPASPAPRRWPPGRRVGARASGRCGARPRPPRPARRAPLRARAPGTRPGPGARPPSRRR